MPNDLQKQIDDLEARVRELEQILNFNNIKQVRDIPIDENSTWTNNPDLNKYNV